MLQRVAVVRAISTGKSCGVGGRESTSRLEHVVIGSGLRFSVIAQTAVAWRGFCRFVRRGGGVCGRKTRGIAAQAAESCYDLEKLLRLDKFSRPHIPSVRCKWARREFPLPAGHDGPRCCAIQDDER